MKPMENIRVVELSTMLAGPMTARILAEWGADVIKVESVNGDAWRKQAGTTLSPCTKDANPNFDVQNMNKRFVCLNLRTEAGRDAIMRLLSGADIFITNYRVQALEPMGLTYEQLKESFPRLIHASVLGYGSEGPESSRPGYDYTVFFARTGLMADLAPAGGPPLIPVESATTAWPSPCPAASPPRFISDPLQGRGIRWMSRCCRPAPLSTARAF